MPADNWTNGKSKLTETERQALIADYRGGLTTYQVAEKYGIKECSAWEFLKRRGLTRPPSITNRRFTYDGHAFNQITPESAYWIGMMMTDGCVTNEGMVCLGLAAKDGDHITRFRNFLKSGHRISQSETRRFSNFHLRAPDLVKSLGIYGVVPRKTFIAKVIGLENDRHFWRGAIDGDGSVILTKWDKYPRPAISLVSASKVFIEQFRSFVMNNVPVERMGIRFGRSVWSTKVSGRFAIDLAKLLYTDHPISMPRKQETANSIIKLMDSHRDIFTGDYRCKNSGVPRTQEWNAAISRAKKGMKWSPEALSSVQKARKAANVNQKIRDSLQKTFASRRHQSTSVASILIFGNPVFVLAQPL